ncbi:MAG: cytochrome C oxidase subunit IV family protein [bacterium]|nr:cytochrome C oxidase subunit IV family protein [bacterium]
MAEHHREPNYYLVLVWLAVLTIAEIIVAKSSIPTLTTGILLVGMASSKAVLVALFFMHLKFETSTLMVIAGIPFIICTFLVFMLMPDLTAIEGGRMSDIRAEQTESGHKK